MAGSAPVVLPDTRVVAGAAALVALHLRKPVSSRQGGGLVPPGRPQRDGGREGGSSEQRPPPLSLRRQDRWRANASGSGRSSFRRVGQDGEAGPERSGPPKAIFEAGAVLGAPDSTDFQHGKWDSPAQSAYEKTERRWYPNAVKTPAYEVRPAGYRTPTAALHSPSKAHLRS